MLNLSFRVHTIGWRGALFILIFAPIGLTLPAVVGAWYVFGPQPNAVARATLTDLRYRQPATDARQAAAAGDLRVLRVPRGERLITPGFRPPKGPTAGVVVFRDLPQISGQFLSPQEIRLNRAGIDYARAYNEALVQCLAAPHDTRGVAVSAAR